LSSLDFTVEDYNELQVKLLRAAQQMKSDGWWLTEMDQPGRNKKMKSRLLWGLLGNLIRIPKPLQQFYAEVIRRKVDDHHASHSHLVNQFFHLISSSIFIYCYILAFTDLAKAMCFGLASLFLRQFGHAIIEPPSHDQEEALLGFNTRNKTLIVAGYGLIPIVHVLGADAWTLAGLKPLLTPVAEQWFFLTLAVVLGRVLYLIWEHNFGLSMVWLIKLMTDPFTDIVAYYPSAYGAVKGCMPSRLRKR
jgi:glutamate-1-semialdehyde 2,1-aminomutase